MTHAEGQVHRGADDHGAQGGRGRRKVQDVVRRLGITETTLHRWKSKYGGLEVSDVKRLKVLEGRPEAEDARHYPTGSQPWAVTVGDFNGDGIAALSETNAGSGTVGVLLGNGDGTFKSTVDYPTDSSPYPVAVNDLNADGKADLVVANGLSNTISVLAGKGDGTFEAAVGYQTGTVPLAVTVDDFNGDGAPDIAVANMLGNSVLAQPEPAPAIGGPLPELCCEVCHRAPGPWRRPRRTPRPPGRWLRRSGSWRPRERTRGTCQSGSSRRAGWRFTPRPAR
jgi:hypothetical protein